MKRYFIISYVYFLKNGSYGYGDATIMTTGGYCNQKQFIDYFKDDNENIVEIVVQNIIELNESDYNDYIS